MGLHHSSLEEFKAASHQKHLIVSQEFACDDLTPTQAFLALDSKEGSVLLESAVTDNELGRYSLLAIEPFAEFTSKGSCDALDRLREAVKSSGSAIGFATYDAVRLFESIPDRHPDTLQLPDFFFLFHKVRIAFDHMKNTIVISVVVDPSKEDYAMARKKIEETRKLIKSTPKQSQKRLNEPPVFFEEMSDAEFCQKIEKAKEHIKKGDVFQVVLSRSFSCPFNENPFDVYRALRMVNPSPFMFYMQTRDFAIAGSSPERLLKVENGMMLTNPIAGTSPRIAGQEEKIVEKLLQDPKEDAEHMMLVDLGRNDLGVVSEIGSVKVKELKKAKYFPHVIHLVSVIEGKLSKEYDALDAFKAVFPAGTLSGAPKIRAMEIIDNLELSRRGLYGGAICTIDHNGNLDSCIAIRTAFFKDGMATVRAGSGIVYDSDPQQEAQETRAKAKGVIDAIQLALEGTL